MELFDFNIDEVNRQIKELEIKKAAYEKLFHERYLNVLVQDNQSQQDDTSTSTSSDEDYYQKINKFSNKNIFVDTMCIFGFVMVPIVLIHMFHR